MRVDLFTDVAQSVCSACAEYVVSYYPSATRCVQKHSHRQPNKKPRKETCPCVRTALSKKRSCLHAQGTGKPSTIRRLRVFFLRNDDSCLFEVPRWQNMFSSQLVVTSQDSDWRSLLTHEHAVCRELRHAARTRPMVWAIFALGTYAVATPASTW